MPTNRPDIRTATTHNTENLDEVNAKAIDDLLTYIALCERTPTCPDNATFDGATLLIGTEDCTRFGYNPGNREQLIEIGRSLPRWKSKFAIIPDPTMEGVENDRYELHVVCEYRDKINVDFFLAQNKMCGLPKTISAITSESFRINTAGIMRKLNTFLFFRNNGKIVLPRQHRNKNDIVSVSRISTGTILNLKRQRDTWSIHFRIAPDTPSIGFFTDPIGVKEFLQFRDKGDEARRRPALTHWVTQHWRQTRQNPDVEVYVREHLRGKTTCTWHGMEARISIPDLDLLKAERAGEDRKRLSAAGLARRLRERNRGRS
jgi:hypothetical protein